eukprot:3711038-Prorocentrum_lima.AAC.1
MDVNMGFMPLGKDFNPTGVSQATAKTRADSDSGFRFVRRKSRTIISEMPVQAAHRQSELPLQGGTQFQAPTQFNLGGRRWNE